MTLRLGLGMTIVACWLPQAACGGGGSGASDAGHPRDGVADLDAATAAPDQATASDTAEVAGGNGGTDAPSNASSDTSSDAADAPSTDATTDPCSGTLSAADSAAYFPFVTGALWSFHAAGTSNGVPFGPRLTRLEVVGTQASGAAILRSTHLDLDTNVDQYLDVTPGGLVVRGGTGQPSLDANADLWAAPYTAVPFPIVGCPTVERFRIAPPSPMDLDGDGKPDTIEVSETASLSFEDVTVPVGTFKKALRVVANRDVAVTFTRGDGGTSHLSSPLVIDWYASGVGPIKRTVGVGNSVTTSELIGYSVAGTAHGVVPTGWLSPSLDLGDVNRPAIGFDGKRFLVVVPTSLQMGTYMTTGNLQAFVVDGDGSVVSTKTLLDAADRMTAVAIAWDGARYLVAYVNTSYRRLEIITVSPDGDTLDGPIVLDAKSAIPSVIATSAGFLVATTETVQNPPTYNYQTNVWLTALDAHGHATSRVSPFPTTQQWLPVLAPDDAGGVMALFLTPPATPSPTLPETANILAAGRLTADGHAVDAAPFAVASMPMVGHSEADLVFDGTGFVASWLEQGTSTSSVRLARIAKDGTLLDGPATSGGIVVGDPKHGKSAPRLGRLGAGSLVVWGWQDAKDAFTSGIAATRFTPDGRLLDVPSADDGRWVVGDFGASVHALPEILWGVDHALMAWSTPQIAQTGKFGLGAAVAYPW